MLVRGVDLPADLIVDLPIWSFTAALWNCHSWPLDVSMGSRYASSSSYMGFDVVMWNCHSWPLDVSIRRVDLPVDLPIWDLTVAMWNCHSWPLDVITNDRSIERILAVDLPIWTLAGTMWYCHSWPLDISTGGWNFCQGICLLICLYELSQ